MRRDKIKYKIILICLVIIVSNGNGIKVYAEDPVADVFELMRLINQEKEDILWPGFHPGEIPTAVFDGVNTYLFKHPSPPEGFAPLADKEDVSIFSGQYNQVRGNSRMQVKGTWTATSVLRTHSRLTGEKYSLQNLAGIIIHEQFHVFQRLKHPDWSPNDGYLFNYPLDTPDMLALRRMEVEAFRRAVTAQNDKKASGWLKEALKWRDKRYRLMDDTLINYEGELQRFEGLAEYIEKTSGGSDPTQIPVDPGFAPAAIRHLGYILGRWSAVILDRLEPDWKNKLESGEIQYLHELLRKIAGSSDQKCEFSDKEQELYFKKAKNDVENRKSTVQKLQKEFNSLPGYQIHITASKEPLRLQMFFADRTEALSEKELLHSSLVMLRNEKGSVTVRDLMSITENNGSTGVIKFKTSGITEKPVIDKNDVGIKVTAKGFQAEFSGAKIEEWEDGVKIVI